MMINDYIAGLCIYCSILFTIILVFFLLTKRKRLLENSMSCYASNSLINLLFPTSLITSFSLVLDSVLSCFVHHGP